MRLINRDFARLFYGQAISVVGNIVFDTTLVLWISTDLLPGDAYAPVAVSGVMIAVAVSAFAVGPVAGVFVDRWNPMRTMMVTDGLRALLIAFLAVLAALPHDTLPAGPTIILIYLIVFLANSGAQFFNPSRMAVVSEIVPEQERARATGILQATGYTAAIAGPPLAAPLLFETGATVALALNAASFVVSFLTIRGLRVSLPALGSRAPSAEPDAGAPLRRFRAEFRSGIRFVVHSPVLRVLLMSLAVATFGSATLNALNVFFIPENLHAKAGWFGTIGMGEGAGALTGALVAGRLCRRFRDITVFGAGLTLVGIGLVVYARSPSLWVAVPVIVVIGVPLGAINAALSPILLRATPREYLGRTVSTFVPVQQLASMVSAVAAGWLVSTLWRNFHHRVAGIAFGRIDTVYLLGGIAITVSGVLASVMLRSAESAVESIPARVPVPVADAQPSAAHPSYPSDSNNT